MRYLLLALLLFVYPSPILAAAPFVDGVVSFVPGTNAGFGADRLPGVVLGPPQGAGLLQGSFDVVSLGDGGSIILRFDLPLICDGVGPDFTVFENAFHAGAPSGPLFIEVGIVAVSQDGENFVEFPYDPATFVGLAGRSPVLSHPDNGIDPLDPRVSGGDSFDLAAVGLPWAAFVRITDPGSAIPDSGSRVPSGNSGGFDLDALAALHACDPSAAVTVTPTATHPPPSNAPRATSTATTTPTSLPADLPSLLHALFSKPWEEYLDLNRDGCMTAADVVRAVTEGAE